MPGINEVQVITAGGEILVNPELKDAVRSARGIQLYVGFDTTPCSRKGCAEDRDHARPQAKPSEIEEIVIVGRDQAAILDPGGGIND